MWNRDVAGQDRDREGEGRVVHGGVSIRRPIGSGGVNLITFDEVPILLEVSPLTPENAHLLLPRFVPPFFPAVRWLIKALFFI